MSARRAQGEAAQAAAVLAEIAGWAVPYSGLGKRLHALLLRVQPSLKPRLWYGMPGYALARSKPVLCYFRVDEGLMTFGLTEKAQFAVAAGAAHQLMPSAWYFTELDAATEQELAAILQRALG